MQDNRVVFSAVSSHLAVHRFLTREYCATDVNITISSAVGIYLIIKVWYTCVAWGHTYWFVKVSKDCIYCMSSVYSDL